jgi:hypothetical protein
MRFKEKVASRKFWLALMLFLIASVSLILPVIVNILFGTAIVILTGAEYVSLCTVIYGIYAGSNVYEKHVTNRLAGNEEYYADKSANYWESNEGE